VEQFQHRRARGPALGELGVRDSSTDLAQTVGNPAKDSIRTVGTSSGWAWHSATITTVPNTRRNRKNGDSSSRIGRV
jgi:hypothetical protein